MTGVETGVVVAAVVVLVVFGLLILGMCAVAGRRKVRRAGPAAGAFADQVGIALGPTPEERADERIRAIAAADAAEAAFVTPGCRRVDAFLDELFERRPR